MVIDKTRARGFTFVEVIVASAIMLLFFSGLISGVKLMIELIGQTKAETGARSLALSKMEYIRSLDYAAIGTVGGIPSGSIPQTSTSTLNNVEYTERVLILYVDRPEDGLESLDENGVLEDSKRVKIEYSWTIKGVEKSLSLISDIAPKGMETTSGGGTLIVKVFDAAVAAVDGATVRLVNTSEPTDPIDITLATNIEGRAIIPGAPARGGYEITVTKNGYSTDGTYSVTAENSNPSPPHVAVASSTISTMTFFIDRLSNVTIESVGDPVTYEFIDDFTNGDLLSSQSGTAVTGSQLVLAGDGFGGYVASGEAYSTTTAPTSFTSWQSFDWNSNTPADTELKVQLYADQGGGRTLIPNSVLSGNEAGFVSGPIDISFLSPDTYPQLSLQASLSTTDASSTPAVSDWKLSYIESEPPISDVTFNVAGTKTIGTDTLKYEEEVVTGPGGSVTVPLEWDSYTVGLNGVAEGYDIKEVRGVLPYLVSPGSDSTLSLVLTPHTDHTLHLTVTDSSGTALPGASVQLTRTGYNETLETSVYGQVFFSDLSGVADYSLSVTKAGYQNYTNTISIDGNIMQKVNLTLQ